MHTRRIRIWSDKTGISKQEPFSGDFRHEYIELRKTYKTLLEVGAGGYVLNKLEELIEYCEAQIDGDKNGIIDAICDSRIYDATELIKEGYCISDCDEEVLKVIESRSGSWSEELGKFVKCQTKECREKWYNPRYIENCKYKEHKID